MHMFKTRLGIVAMAAVGLFAFASGAHALMFKNGDAVSVPKDEIVAGSLYVAGANITVDGKVQGDLVCAGQNITVNGTVDGDVLCAGQIVTINGNVGGSVRAAGNSVSVNGKVARSVMAASSNLSFGASSEVGWDVLFGSATADLRGNIKRDLDGAGAAVTMAGPVGRNAWLMMDDRSSRAKEKNTTANAKPNLVLAKGAAIGGTLTYTANRDAELQPGSSVKGEVKRHEPTMKTRSHEKDMSAWIWWRIIVIFSALICGLILASWLRRPLLDIGQRLLAKPYKALGLGALVMFLTPLAAIVLMITLIGLPVGIILLMLWGIVMYLGKIVTAIIIGHELLKRYGRKAGEARPVSLIWAMIVGIVLMFIIFSIPVIGWLVSLVATLIGVGGIWMYGQEKSCQKTL